MSSSPEQAEWLVEPLSPDVRRALDRLSRAPDVQRIVVLPDVHLASEVCIGTVVATTNSLYPAAVGGDIGCGMSALAFDADAELVRDARNADRILRELNRLVPILRHRRTAQQLPDRLSSFELSAPGLEKFKEREAAQQLGTLGRGNHFLELQEDEDGRLWLMVHSGSRAMGQSIRAHHEFAGERVIGGLRRLEADGEAGLAYLNDQNWALEYADENRTCMQQIVAQLLGELFGVVPLPDLEIACHHNFVRLEPCLSGPLWVHRKGAISAAAGEAGILPGSMATESFHVEGRGHPESLCSSSHGAGRKLARGEAHRKLSTKQVTRELEGVHHDLRLASKLKDEAPSAYKDVRRVLRAQRDLTRVRRRLRPLLCYKGA